MEFRYFPESDMLYIQLMDGVSTESEEVAPYVVLDRDADSRVLGIEIEDASQYMKSSKQETHKNQESVMFNIATITPNKMVQLPGEIAARLLPTDRFIVWLEGDTLHLKRLASSPLKQVEDAPDDEPMTLDEINEIVHHVRRQSHHRSVE